MKMKKQFSLTLAFQTTELFNPNLFPFLFPPTLIPTFIPLDPYPLSLTHNACGIFGLILFFSDVFGVNF